MKNVASVVTGTAAVVLFVITMGFAVAGVILQYLDDAQIRAQQVHAKADRVWLENHPKPDVVCVEDRKALLESFRYERDRVELPEPRTWAPRYDEAWSYDGATLVRRWTCEELP